MVRDPVTGETFARVVGRRERPAMGPVPTAARRQALATLAHYRTRAPKGVFIYRSHEEMDADRMRWTVEAVVTHERHG
jgi:hypothetical protein